VVHDVGAIEARGERTRIREPTRDEARARTLELDRTRGVADQGSHSIPTRKERADERHADAPGRTGDEDGLGHQSLGDARR
jgi:hypothetical protein